MAITAWYANFRQPICLRVKRRIRARIVTRCPSPRRRGTERLVRWPNRWPFVWPIRKLSLLGCRFVDMDRLPISITRRPLVQSSTRPFAKSIGYWTDVGRDAQRSPSRMLKRNARRKSHKTCPTRSGSSHLLQTDVGPADTWRTSESRGLR